MTKKATTPATPVIDQAIIEAENLAKDEQMKKEDELIAELEALEPVETIIDEIVQTIIVDQEIKEQKIKDQAIAKATSKVDDCKEKLIAARLALHKLTGKTKEPKSPGVIASILTLVEKAPKKTGISKDDILNKLIEMFPDRASESMKNTISVQLPSRMNKEKNVKIVKLETGCFVME